MVALQSQVTEVNKLLQSMALLEVNAAGSSLQIVHQTAELGFVECGGPYNTDTCPICKKTVSYVKHDPYSKNYNEGWRDHPNFSLRGQKQNAPQ